MMDEMDAALHARINCAAVIAAFAHHVDHREFDQAVVLFAEDGVFLRPDVRAHGRTEIARIWEGRPESVVTKHMLSPPHFTAVSAAEVRAVTPFTLYTVEWNGEGLPRFDRPPAIAEFHDRLVLTDDGWKIAERRGVPVLLPA